MPNHSALFSQVVQTLSPALLPRSQSCLSTEDRFSTGTWAWLSAPMIAMVCNLGMAVCAYDSNGM